jgi:hypothetical protein
VRESTAIQHRPALGRVVPVLGDRPVDRITSADVAELVARLHGEGKARESIRKSVTALSMVLDFAGVTPNPARDRVQVRLPREEATEPEPPTAETVEAVLWRLMPAYALAAFVLETTGARVGWLVRATVSKTRRRRWVVLEPAVFEAVVERLPAREDRDPTARLFPGVTADRLRMAIGRACRDAGCRTSRRTRSGTAGSASCTGRASHGPTSANGSGSGRRSSRPIGTRTRSSTTARSTGRRCSIVLAVLGRCVPLCVPTRA